MLCVVIGIVPSLDDTKRISFLQQHAPTRMKNAEGDETRICWARDTRENSWVVLDEDADDEPTMLLSAYLFNSEENGLNDVYGSTDLRTNPEEFASFVADLLDGGMNHAANYACEVWASAPAPLPLTTFGRGGGVNNSSKDKSPNTVPAIQSSDIGSQRMQSDFREKGLCLLPNIFTFKNDEVNESLLLPQIRSMVDEAIQEAEAAITRNHPNINIGEDSFLFREIASRSKQRFDLLIPKKSELYQLLWDRIRGTEISGLLQKLFSGQLDANTELQNVEVDHNVEWEMDLSVVYSKPRANHQGWHADGGHTEGAPDAGWNDDDGSASLAAPYAICLFVPLIDLDGIVGFTQFWPGSHKHRDLVGFGPFAEVAKATWDGIVSAGEAIIYDYRLLHRGMPNQSATKSPHPYRAVLQLLCRRSWYKEKNNYGTDSIYQTAR